MPERKQQLVEVEDLRVHFGSQERPVKAVDGVSFGINERETVALVGESGCGKSVTALSLAKLVPIPPGRYVAGIVRYRGDDVLAMDAGALRKLRGDEIAYVFQEPSTSLNPVFRVGYQIAEALRLHRRDVDAREEVLRLMRLVGLPEPERRSRAYPHELSGGMQQRVMIAMALACNPRLLIADEPTTALDVTIQAQILELLGELQEQLGMTVLLITHNLGLVADVSHRVMVMYAGHIVETGPTAEVLAHPRHPYTRALVAAVPRIDETRDRLEGIPGSVPNPADWPEGCRFNPRCPFAQERCRRDIPGLAGDDPERRTACHFWPEIASGELQSCKSEVG
jgi:oligopeptide/dipeptide ABC transporter ATP-binding protein